MYKDSKGILYHVYTFDLPIKYLEILGRYFSDRFDDSTNTYHLTNLDDRYFRLMQFVINS